jgi:oligoribonuclease (3'-5' exoribonuclease)
VAALSEQVNKLTKEVTGLRKQTTRMIELIDIITPDNLDEIKLKIKKLHEDNQA